MKNQYFQRAAMTLGIAAIAATGVMAEGTWRNINSQYLKNPAFLPAWCGALSAVGEEIGETYNSAFEIYQVLPDMPAGKYTLTVNAFYRAATNDRSVELMKDGANHNAYIFLGTAKTAVEGLRDKGQKPVAATAFDGDGNATEWETFDPETHSPNGLGEAKTAFEAGKYVNKVEFDHPGGDLRLGIANTGGQNEEWTAFDNFKLQGPNGEVTVPNGDFKEGFENADNIDIWDMHNISGSVKTVDINKDGGALGCYRKTNASPYNFGQRVELPAGKYRFGVQSFLRHGNGNESGWYCTIKGWSRVEGESAYDIHVAGKEEEKNNAYLYVTDGWDLADDEVTIMKPVDEDGATYGKEDAYYKVQPIMCIFDEEMDNALYPDNTNHVENPDVENGARYNADSGWEHEAAAFFVANPDKYRNYIEFELTEPTKVWVGFKKDVNAPVHYWNPFRDFTLEMYDAEENAVQGIAAENADAPVEYYTIDGVRVSNPENGLYIVKQGNKVTKQIFK